jgi:hypothetical protein
MDSIDMRLAVTVAERLRPRSVTVKLGDRCGSLRYEVDDVHGMLREEA